MESKICTSCKTDRPISRFRIRVSSGKFRGVCMDCHNSKTNEKRAEMKKMVFDHYGWKCRCCGEENPVFLTMDHINNDGYKDKMVGGRKLTGKDLYLKIIREGLPSRFQTLCQNCNFGKKVKGICPHQNAK